MNLQFTQEELDFQKEVRDWIKENYPEDMRERYISAPNGHLTKEEQVQWQKSLYAKGWAGINWPAEYGGAAFTASQKYIYSKEMAAASAPGFLAFGVSMVAPVIMAFGSDEQKKKYLPKLASGEMIGCFSLSEPNAGSDAGSLSTFAEDKGDHYEITGGKNWITNGVEAGIAVVFAKTRKTDNHRGISAFIVETSSDGYEIIKVEDKLGIRGSSTTQVALDNVKVPKGNLLGEEEKGFRVAMSTLDGGRIGIAAQALGIAEAAFRYAKYYSKERVQFGHPISNLQAIQFILADMSTKIAAGRHFVTSSSYKKDQKKDYGLEAAQAKVFCSETAMWTATKAIQVCGGNGFTTEYPVERYFRDAKITEIYEGTSEVQRIVIATKELK